MGTQRDWATIQKGGSERSRGSPESSKIVHGGAVRNASAPYVLSLTYSNGTNFSYGNGTSFRGNADFFKERVYEAASSTTD